MHFKSSTSGFAGEVGITNGLVLKNHKIWIKKCFQDI